MTSTARPLAWIALIGLVSGCASTGMGTIRGRVRVPAGAAEVPGRGGMFVYVQPDRAPSAARTSPPAARMLQTGSGFEPHVLTVPVGTTVTFVNGDRVYHNVFSVSPVRRFDVGRYGPKSTRHVTFERPGLVRLFCELHPAASGYVIVVPSPQFVRADPAGTFTLPRLAKGTYTVHAWHPMLGERSRRVEVERGHAVDVALSF